MNEKVDSVVVLVPILNFDCTKDRIDLGKGLSIRRTYFDEIENLIKQLPNPIVLKSMLGDTKFVIEKRATSDEISPMWFSPANVTAEKITLTFRLLNFDDMPMPTAFYLTADSTYISNPHPKRNTIVGNYQILYNNQINEFKNLWKALNKIETRKPHLVFPLAQFDKSFNASLEETFIDYMTAFESIVFARGKNAPYPYGRVIGIAIGMLIGKDAKERTTIEQKLNAAYEVRNKVVHGHLRHKMEGNSYEATSNLLASTRAYLIRSLRKLIDE